MKSIESHSLHQMIILSLYTIFILLCNCLFPCGLFFFDLVLFFSTSYSIALGTTAFIIGCFFYDDTNIRTCGLYFICFIGYWFIVYNSYVAALMFIFIWYCMTKLAHRYFYHGYRLFLSLYGAALIMQGLWFLWRKGYLPWHGISSFAALYISIGGVVFWALIVIYLWYGKQGNRGEKSNLSSRKVRTP